MDEVIDKLKNKDKLSHKEIAWIIERLELTDSLNELLESKSERILNQYRLLKEYEGALLNIANSDGWLIEPNPLCTIEEAYDRCVEKATKVLKI